MPAYISEIDFIGPSSEDYIEIAVPEGTDVTDYTIVVYASDGTVKATYSLGSIVTTIAGYDVYLVDAGTSGFTGVTHFEAVALVDDTTVLQFVSFHGNTITATEGPANDLTSTEIGTLTPTSSLQSDDGGASYYVQTVQNPGSIPRYAPGTMIDTPVGPRAVETLVPGDSVMTLDRGPQPIIWPRARLQ